VQLFVAAGCGPISSQISALQCSAVQGSAVLVLNAVLDAEEVDGDPK
jgi:hypothetical protein